MIPPRQQWCIQIDVTNACNRRCSNCTRLLGHVRTPFHMAPETFEQAVLALKDFPAQSEPDLHGRRKVIGIMGGEPLLHPQFGELVDIMCAHVPRPHRGLWTGVPWQATKHRLAVEKLLGREPSILARYVPGERNGYLNYNPHKARVEHQPVLVASADVVPDRAQRDRLIDACWVQNQWAGAITPKGFFFCEVAAAFDMVFGGPGGFAITPECWRFDIGDYFAQIQRWCPRCGMPLPMQGRLDSEGIDDISLTNLYALAKIDSPRIEAAEFNLVETADYIKPETWKPAQYIKGKR